MTYPVYGGPVTASSVSDLQQNFHWMYAACNGFQNVPLMCNWQNFKNQLNINPAWATANGEGVLFYYMLESNAGGNYFSYAIINAQRDAMGNFEPTPGATYFSLLPAAGGIKTYSTPAELLYMNQCITNYEVLCLTRNIPNLIAGATVPVSGLLNHPKKAFLSSETIWQFFDDNSTNILGTTDIYLLNGAEYTDVVAGPLENQFKAQTPVLAYANGANMLLSDENPDMSKLFMDKALERGAKCPPQCA